MHPVRSFFHVVFKPTSNIILGAEIERALRAVQRDEGWNCKGAPRRRSKRKPLTLPHNTTSRAFTTRGRLSCQPPHLHYSTIQPAQQGRSGKEKSNPAQKGIFRRICGGFFGGFFSVIVSFLDFFAFSGGFLDTKNNAPFIQSDTGKMRCPLDFLPYISYVNINNFKIASYKTSEKGEKVNFSMYC